MTSAYSIGRRIVGSALVVLLGSMFGVQLPAHAAESRLLTAADFSGYQPSKAQFAHNRGALTIANHRFQRGVDLETFGGPPYTVGVSLRVSRLAGFHAIQFHVGMEDRTTPGYAARFLVTIDNRTVLQQDVRQGDRAVNVVVPFAAGQLVKLQAYSLYGEPSYVLIADPVARLTGSLTSSRPGVAASYPPGTPNRYVKKTEFAGIDNHNASYLASSSLASINGVRYVHALQLEPCGGSFYTVGATINTRPYRNFRALTFTVGMEDQNPAHSTAHIIVQADSRTVFERDIVRGSRPRYLSFPLQHVEAYSLKAYRVKAYLSTGNCVYPLFGKVMAVH